MQAGSKHRRITPVRSRQKGSALPESSVGGASMRIVYETGLSAESYER